MHKTVSSFMERTGWAKGKLPDCLTAIFHDHLCTSTACEAVMFVESRSQRHINDIIALSGGGFCSSKVFRGNVKQATQDVFVTALAPLLHFAILYVIGGITSTVISSGDTEVRVSLEALLRSRLASLHFAFSKRHASLLLVQLRVLPQLHDRRSSICWRPAVCSRWITVMS